MLDAVSLYHWAKDIVLLIKEKQILRSIGAIAGERKTMASMEGSTTRSAGRKHQKNIEIKIIGVNPV